MGITYDVVLWLNQSNIMSEVVKAAEAGKPVLGICNGFQVLTEAGLASWSTYCEIKT